MRTGILFTRIYCSLVARYPILLRCTAFILLYWILETALESIVFTGGSFWENLFPLDPHEIWHRVPPIAVFVLASLYIKSAVEKQKKAEEEVIRRTKEIKNFAYSVSHDLKSPAIGLSGLVNLLNQKYSDVLDEKGKNYCEHIMKAGKYIGDLVENINVFIKSRELPLTIEEIELTETLEMIRDQFSTSWAMRNVELYTPETPIRISADRLSLHRIFRNLIDNAMHHGGEGLSKIIIEYSESEKFHYFCITDDGKGIKEEDQERVFEPFTTLQSPNGAKGSGMGLAIVREIVERHNGKISVESVPEKGTNFLLTLPKGRK
jgi:signal transduction histidine kinase